MTFPNFLRITYKPDFDLKSATENYALLLFPAVKHD